MIIKVCYPESDLYMIEFFKVSIASVNIEIECLYRTVFNQCKNYLNDFENADLVISTSHEEIEREVSRLPSIENQYTGVATNRELRYIESIIIQRKMANSMLSFNGFLMHGSVVAKDGYAYMFTAPSGIGKTTRTRLWLDAYPSSIVVNGDKPIIKIGATDVYACGTPWCGKEGWNTNTMVPLRAVFLLERAEKEEKSSIEEIHLGKALPFLLQQIHRPEDPELMRKTLQLLKALEGKVKIYKFRSTPTEESVRLAYEIAKPQ